MLVSNAPLSGLHVSFKSSSEWLHVSLKCSSEWLHVSVCYVRTGANAEVSVCYQGRIGNCQKHYLIATAKHLFIIQFFLSHQIVYLHPVRKSFMKTSQGLEPESQSPQNNVLKFEKNFPRFVTLGIILCFGQETF